MSDRGVDPPGASDAEAAEGERRLRKSRRGLRLTGSHPAPAASAPDLDLPDLDSEMMPEAASDAGDVEITASDEVEVSVAEHEVRITPVPVPVPAPVAQPEPGMRVVRRRIRKIGSDAPPSDDPVLTIEVGHTEPPAAPAPATRPSRPPPPRPSNRPAAISPTAPSIFTAPTIPPMPEPGPSALSAVPLGVPRQVEPLVEVEVVLSTPTDVEVMEMRPSDPSLALLDELADLPIGGDAHPPRVTPSRIPPPPPKPLPSVAPPPPPKAAPRPLAVTVPDQQRRRRRHWWEELFNDDYLRTVVPLDAPQIAAETDWIEHALGVEGGAAVLDVACGVGRHACELALRGYDVTGIDLSPTMVQRAQALAQGCAQPPAFSQADMMALDYEESFDAAYCVGSSFGFFDDQRNSDVATRIHRALKDNGTFLLQVINRDHAIQSQPAMAWFEGDSCVCMEESSVNYITSRLNVKRTVIFDDGRQREIEFSVRLYSLHELGQLLHQSGFRILEVSGHVRTPGAFFGPSSRELIILAQKRGAEVVELADHGDHHDDS